MYEALNEQEQQEAVWREAAMQYRNALSFPAEYDSRRTDIDIYGNWDTDLFVVASTEKQAKDKWLEKYGSVMPDEIECNDAETSSAGNIAYTGTVQLTDEEKFIVRNAAAYGDFTLDMLWLLVEGLGWRPGNPVAEDDIGWIAVWAEQCGLKNVTALVISTSCATCLGCQARTISGAKAPTDLDIASHHPA